MRVIVFGGGPLGLVTAGVLAQSGCDVVCLENDVKRLSCLLEDRLPIFEPGLKELLKSQCDSKRLKFCHSTEPCRMENSFAFICVDTPALLTNRLDVSNVYDAVLSCASNPGPSTLVIRSTVPVGTMDMMQQQLYAMGRNKPAQLVYNPEFMRAGRVVDDFLNPNRVVMGADNINATNMLKSLYENWLPDNTPMMITDFKSAELIKLASNAFIAMELSFVNELSDLCGCIDVDSSDVIHGLAIDPRIGIRAIVHIPNDSAT